MESAAQSLLQRAPPADGEVLVRGLGAVVGPEAVMDVLQKEASLVVHQTVLDPANASKEKPFILCQYNRIDAVRYRSPWTGDIWKVRPGGGGSEGGDDDKPAAKATEEDQEDELRMLESTFNDVWEAYKNLYYGHESVSSVYLQKDGEAGSSGIGAFAGFFGIHKSTAESVWDSTNWVHAEEPIDNQCQYTLKTLLCVVLRPLVGENDNHNEKQKTESDISLSISKDVVKTCPLSPKVPVAVSHIENIGSLIEDVEMELRSGMEKVQIPKTQEILDTIQKKPEQDVRPKVNPIMGMMMNSEVLKKKLAKQQQQI
jgi:capping protein beta